MPLTIVTTHRAARKTARAKLGLPETKVTTGQRVMLVLLTVLTMARMMGRTMAPMTDQTMVPMTAPTMDRTVTPEAILTGAAVAARLREVEMAARRCTACLDERPGSASPRSGSKVRGSASTINDN